MLNLPESIRSQCPDIDSGLIDMHLRRMPNTYYERYSPTDLIRHLRLLYGLENRHLIDVTMTPITSQVFEVVVVGVDFPGVVACVTAALAAYRFDLEDVHVSPYLDPDPSPGEALEPSYFVIALRVSGSLRGRLLAEFVTELRDRLRAAFVELSQGNFLQAQTIAADNRELTGDASHAGDRSASPSRSPSYEGLLLGNDFRIDRKLATGGMSEVYLATQLSLNRTAAIKLFRHEGTADDEHLARFKQEALVLAQFSCANIVPIFAAGTVIDATGAVLGWMAMEYMAGGDLGRWLQEHGGPSAELAVRWFTEALQGLYYAHRRGIVHRDLKPHNLLLTADGHLKVSDFGLLKQAQEFKADRTPHYALVGTPQYMSPEQALGEALDERSDIFSLGTTFFYLLSGRLPFQKNTAAAVLVQIAQEDAPRLKDVAAQVPLPLAVIIQRMMARPREERYQDVAVILEDLASYERRGLLSSSQDGGFVAAVPVEINDPADTQAYQPPLEGVPSGLV